jgi:hypothetical protein
MGNNAVHISTPLQRGGKSRMASQPFQRFAGREETVETVLLQIRPRTPG